MEGVFGVKIATVVNERRRPTVYLFQFSDGLPLSLLALLQLTNMTDIWAFVSYYAALNMLIKRNKSCYFPDYVGLLSTTDFQQCIIVSSIKLIVDGRAFRR